MDRYIASTLLLLLLSSRLVMPSLADNDADSPEEDDSPEGSQDPALMPPESSIMGFFEGERQRVSCKDGKPMKGLQVWWGELDKDLSYQETVIMGMSFLCHGGKIEVERSSGVATLPDSTFFGFTSNDSRKCICSSGGINFITWRRAKFEERPDGEDDEEMDEINRQRTNRFMAGIIVHCAQGGHGRHEAMVADLTDEDPAQLEREYQYRVICPPGDGTLIKVVDLWASPARLGGFEVKECAQQKIRRKKIT